MSKLTSDHNVIAWLDDIISNYEVSPTALIPILQDVQKQYNYLPEDLLIYIAMALDMSPATVYGVATFYAQFSLEPKGEFIIKVCDGTACHVRQSMPVYEAIRKKVKLVDGKSTTQDLKYTVETVSCLGACGLAPVVTINEQVYGQMTPEAITVIIDELENRTVKGND